MTTLYNELHKTVKKNLEGGDESDQFQTPPWALPMVSQYFPIHSRFWEPACGKGNIVRYLEDAGNSVLATDYLMGEEYNFFTYTPIIGWDFLITNPPWSLKIEWTLRCLELGKPFALLVPLTYLEEEGTRIVHRNEMEIIKPYGRIAYETPHEGWWSHYDQMLVELDGYRERIPCKYKQPDEFWVCPNCGGTDKIRKIKSSPQKQSIWITWGLNIGQSWVYYDLMKQDRLIYSKDSQK